MNPLYLNLGLGLLLVGALLFIYFMKLVRGPQRDLAKELKAKDLEGEAP